MKNSAFIYKEKRTVMEKPNPSCYRDYRYILKLAEIEDKIIKYPIEIHCEKNQKINIKNCFFEKELNIRVDYETSIENIYLYGVDINKTLNININGEVISNSIDIDSCNINRMNIVSGNIEKKIYVYLSDIEYFNIEGTISNTLEIEKSSIGIFTYIDSEIEKVNVQKNTFLEHGVVPGKLYEFINKKESKIKALIKKITLNDSYAKETSLETLDFLLKNRNSLISVSEINEIYYERNRLQTSSIVNRFFLWMFGYFHNLGRYFVTFSILYILFVTILSISTYFSGENLETGGIHRLVINSLLGLSYTADASVNCYTSILISLYIGAGTILYSGLLVTLINRYKIKV